jgi:ethanolamine permease
MEQNELSKSLSPVQLWGIVVGMVISGMYFGWNYAFELTTPVGFAISTIIVTIFYTTFMFTYAELSTAIPHAGGPSEYASRAMGKFGGYLAGFSCLVEFLFATPAIALSVGAYIHYLIPSVPVVLAATVVYLIFVVINCIGVKTAAVVELLVTIVAIAGLIMFAVAGAPHINIANYEVSNLLGNGGIGGVFGAIPFAIWFYLAVEGGALAAEECKNPKKDIPKGFLLGIGTLVVLALATLFVASGVMPSSALINTDSPLPAVLQSVFGEGSIIPAAMSFIGLFGLIASLHGIILGYARQTFAMARAGYLPEFLSRVSKNGTPVMATVVSSLVGLLFVLTGQTAIIIVISTFGAVSLYIISLLSFFMLRKKEPNLTRPYKVASMIIPIISSVCVVILFIAIVFSNVSTIIPVIAAFGVAILYYFLVPYKKMNAPVASELPSEA